MKDLERRLFVSAGRWSTGRNKTQIMQLKHFICISSSPMNFLCRMTYMWITFAIRSLKIEPHYGISQHC